MILRNFPDKKNKSPLYIQLYNSIKDDIIKKRLPSNKKLPSKRCISRELGISMTTIINAYTLLQDEGYIYSKERSGYFVSPIENIISIKETRPSETTSFKRKKKSQYQYNFKINNIDTKHFPSVTFKKLLSEVLNSDDLIWLDEKDKMGLYKLRRSVNNYIYSARGVKTSPDNIIISSGMEYLLQILFFILPKTPIFSFENPGYMNLLELTKINNIPYNFRDVSDFNLCDENTGNVLMVTPSHQFPTGNIMSIDQRIKLLNWADKAENRFIIEDDYDSEFKYYGRPIPSLKSLDKGNNVIYIGNFSKSISPSLRLSYMVLPDSLIKSYHKVTPFLNCPVSNMVQLLTSSFIDEGYFQRHLNRMRIIYKKKRDLATSLFENDKIFSVSDMEAGLHFILEIKKNISERDIEEILIKNDIFAEGLSNYYLNKNTNYKYPKLIIGFGDMDENDLIKGICKLKKIIKNM